MNPVPAAWGRIPFELQGRKQWLLATQDSKGLLKVPTTISNDGKLYHADKTDAAQWLTFDYCTEQAANFGSGIGFCLTAQDPYICIDLDVKGAHNEPDVSKHSTQEQLDRFWLITKAFDSYTELSQSGKGLHIWCQGDAAPGAKHDGVEVYSQDRFMVCTGNVIFDKSIEPRQQLVDMLVNEIRQKQGSTAKAVLLDEQEEIYQDEEIYERATSAENASKFNDLWAGRWQQMGYPSQSEADLSLLSMLTFYSRSNAQCRRMFRLSVLGQREKAQKNDRYLDYSLKLIRGRQEQEDRIEEQMQAEGARLAASLLSSQEYAASLGPPAGVQPAVAPLAPAPSLIQGDNSLAWPPGFVGSLAHFIYLSAPRPVKEVAIVAALGWMAGVCGKMWNIPGSGLNIYLILVARSAIGKEAMHSGLSILLAKLRESVPSAQDFVDFSDFASGPALVKACASNSCFVNVAGEWGRKLRRISQDGERDGPMQQLRTVMTNLYQKSGPASVVGGLTYSKKDDNVASVSGVAFSMIGETTPGTFYDALTETMMEDGFLSRFTVVEYAGERPPANHNPQMVPDAALTDRCIEIVIQSKNLISNRSLPIGVSRDAGAAKLMDDFDLECDAEINKTNDEAWRQMWNRAQLKMMRIAALVAVGENSVRPVITEQHVQWSLDLIRRDIKIMQRRVESGDVGSGDGVRERKVIMLIKEYLTKPIGIGYHIPDGMREAGVIPRSYIQIRTARLSSFTGARNGATKSLDETLRSICDSGYIIEMEKAKLFEAYGTTGKSYRILNLPDYSQHK